MHFLARKFSKAKWAEQPRPGANISADAITGCLRTHFNTLSLWYCEKDPKDIKEVALALAAQTEQLDKMDIVLLPKERILQASLVLEESDGKTPVVDLVRRHVDACKLDLTNIDAFARIMREFIDSADHSFRYTAAEIRGILLSAIRDGRLNPDQLSEKLRSKL